MILYTLGYGLGEGTHAKRKADFQNRLREIQKKLDKKLCIIDVRKHGSGSINGKAFANTGYHYSRGLADTVLDIDPIKFNYQAMPFLANHFGGSQSQLLKYRRWFLRNMEESGFEFLLSRKYILDNRDNFAMALLCGCRDAYKFNAEKWKGRGAINCHRVVLAEELLKELGDGWEVEHL